MTGDPIRDLAVMYLTLLADGLNPDLALDVALLVQHNVARAQFENCVLDDLESLPVMEVNA